MNSKTESRKESSREMKNPISSKILKRDQKHDRERRKQTDFHLRQMRQYERAVGDAAEKSDEAFLKNLQKGIGDRGQFSLN